MSTEAPHRTTLPHRTTASFWYVNSVIISVYLGILVVITMMVFMRNGWVTIFGTTLSFLAFGLTVPSPNGRSYVYRSLLEVVQNRQIRSQRGYIINRSVRKVIVEDGQQRRKNLKLDRWVTVNFLSLGDGNYMTEIFTPKNGIHSTPVLIGAWGESIAANAEQVKDHMDRFSEVLNSLSSRYGQNMRVSLCMVKVLPDINDSIRWFNERSSGTNGLPANYLQSMEESIRGTTTYLCYAMISIVRPSGWAKVQPSKLPPDEVLSSQLFGLSDLLIERLTALGVSGVRRPSPADTTILLHGTLDVSQQEILYDARHRDNLQHSLLDIEELSTLHYGVLPTPESIVSTSRYLQVGDTFSRTFVQTGTAGQAVTPGDLQDLYRFPSDMWGGITVTHELKEASAEDRRVELRRRLHQDKSNRRFMRGGITRAKHIAEETELVTEDEELFYAGGHVVHMTMLAHVSAPTAELLAETSQSFQRHFADSRLPIKPIFGDVNQLEARLETAGIPIGM